MSYLGTWELFKCDYCSKRETVNHGMPEGWIWVKTGGPIKHACPLCRDEVPKDQQREPGKLN